jgi:uncharacterized membrane protein
VKVKNPKAPAVKREAEEDWDRTGRYISGECHMHLIIALIVFVGLAAIIVWVADWTSVGARPTAIDVLNRRLARGEIDRAEYDEKRKLIGR